jgi:hypothetical protein
MPRPAFTSKLTLPHRLKQHNANSSTASVNSIPTSRQGSPKRTMSDVKPGLVLRANVIKVCVVAAPRGGERASADRRRAATSLQRTGVAPLTR